MTKVIVIGGGIVGASAAFALVEAGVEVVLVDRHDAGHATAAGAGIISPGTSLRPLPAFYELGAHAMREYPNQIAQLAGAGETCTEYAVVGKLFLAHSDEEAERLGEIQRLFAERASGGMPGLAGIRTLEPGQAQALFPGLARVRRALLIPEAARVDGDFLRAALVRAAVSRGARVIGGDARLVIAGDRVSGVQVAAERLEGDRVVLAAGAWSNALLEPLGLRLGLEPQRGQILHLHLPGADTSRWPILGGFTDQYVVTFGPNRIVVGATRETGSGFDVRRTLGGLKSVFDHALMLAPGLANATIHEVRVGLRPVSADGLPFIGVAPGHEELIVATGHGPSGLQLGPISGQLAARLALGQLVSVDLSAFAVDRPATAIAAANLTY